MPFPFTLPTTSYVPFTESFSSSTHPSLPLATTSSRGVLRDALKKHKRLAASQQAANLASILSIVEAYIPYLFALDGGLCGTKIAGEEVDVVLVKELVVEWRAVLSASIPGREPPRTKLRSLESELFFTLSTLAYTHCLLARAQLHTLYDAASPTAEQRTAAITGAMKQLLSANSVFNYLVTRSQHTPPPSSVPDMSQSVMSGLASLTLAEATLISVYKDDPYPAVLTNARNKENKEWMFKNPEIPKVRAHLFARLSLAAAEHAAKAQAMLSRSGSSKVDGDLLEYCDDLRRTARAKACRFFAIDVELDGKSGEGIAWLRGAKTELGFASAEEEDKKRFGLSKLKKDWQERREDKRIEKGGEWGSDAGKFEEGRILDMLEKKWGKENDTVGAPSCMQMTGLIFLDHESYNTTIWATTCKYAFRPGDTHAKGVQCACTGCRDHCTDACASRSG